MSDLLQIGLPWTKKEYTPPAVHSRKPLTCYLVEPNVVCGAYRYLPYSTGLLRAYAETDLTIKASVRFMPFIYEMDTLPNVVAKFTEPPDIAAFSVAMWNERLNLAVAKEVKRRWPDCLVVFGGCHVPHHPTEYMTKHPFIDVCVRAEGEEPVKEVLLRKVGGAHYTGIPDVTCRVGDEIKENLEHVDAPKDLDRYPSPYTSGLYRDLMSGQTDGKRFQCIIETNRGCPFDCSFCYWAGGGLLTKFRFHSMDYVKDDITWAGKSGVPYLFLADSNFAMHPRDAEIAEHAVKVKQELGAPEKLRVCWGKNTDEKIYNVAMTLHRADMEKGITLARQSNDPTTLKNIRRDNIKLSTYQTLQKRFMDKEIPTYTELILGLPGETRESWKKGIDEILTSSQLKSNLFVYLAQVLPNTELWRPDYREKHGVKTRLVELQEIHGSPRPEGAVTEYEEIVIETSSMPNNEWREMCKFSWMTMLLHSMKAGFFVMAWLWDRFKVPPSELIGRAVSSSNLARRDWERLLDRVVVHGEGRGTILPHCGDIYWDVEEAALLRASEEWKDFYTSLTGVLGELLFTSTKGWDEHEFREVMWYQEARMPSFEPPFRTDHEFMYNIPEYFDRLFTSDPVPLTEKWQKMTTRPRDWGGDKEKFARETVLWGRKSGTMLVPCTWESCE